ncbi:MAG TPA: chromate transporter [Anaerolineae bacterium]|jgi:chromate transporter
MNLLYFFWMFLKASLLSTGGMGNLPFLHNDLIGLGLAQESDFVKAIAVGQLSPGPSGLWSISLGYLAYGWVGAVLALAALTLPTLLIVGVQTIYSQIEKHPMTRDFSTGLALSIVGLSLAVTASLVNASIVDIGGVLIAAGALALGLSRKVPIVVILLLSAVAGVVIYGR